MSWKVQKSRSAGQLIFAITGRLERSDLAELRRLLTSEADSRDFVLDLKCLKLVDRDSVVLLAEYEAAGARLINCPAYIREWITKERAGDR